MCDTIRHRGPDDEGTFVSDFVGIGMRRLSIIDLAGGHQPIHNEDQSIWIVLNGEIYNYRELRNDLEARGHRFYTDSDTETLVHLYEEYGDDFLDHLVGMFGLALWDGKRQRLVVARDRVGEKQIYYGLRNGKLVIGSEIKCLLATDAVSRRLNIDAIDKYLNYLYVPAPATFYTDIMELPPGHRLVFDRTGLHVDRYWDIHFKIDRVSAPDSFVDGFRERFDAAVRSRLVSDVPLGALLSGGVDSSAVVASMCEHASGSVKTYCIGYGGDSSYYDERKYARMVADRFSTEHHEFVVQPDVTDCIRRIVRAFDQPFADSSAIANYYVFRETARSVKVVLSGVGGDELAAGYERHLGIRLHGYYRQSPKWLRETVMERIVNMLPDSKRGSRLIERAKRFIRTGALPADEAYFRFNATWDADSRQTLYSEKLRGAMNAQDTWAPFDCNFNREGIPDDLSRSLYADLMMYLPGDLLTLTDRMSMQSSIEARAPFLDHKLIEYMATVPPELKLKGFEKKHILKQAFRGRLPDEILYRRKQGFTVPLTVWFRNELRPFVEETLSKSRVESTGLFEWSSVRRLLDEHFAGKENHHSRIWALLVMMVWLEEYQPDYQI